MRHINFRKGKPIPQILKERDSRRGFEICAVEDCLQAATEEKQFFDGKRDVLVRLCPAHVDFLTV